MNKSIWMIFFIGLVFIVSCKKEEDSSRTTNVFVSYDDLYNMKHRQPTLDASRIIYHNPLNPGRLSEEQIDKIGDVLTNHNMRTDDVWFVFVLYNNAEYITMDIYFKPNDISERIMKGQHLYCNSLMTDTTADIKRNIYQKLSGSGLNEYVYVTSKEQTGVIQRTPSSQMIPFSCPAGFNDQDLVEIVDFVRSGPSIKRDEDENTLYFTIYPDKVESNLPIHSINRNKESIEVMTGSQEGPMSGSGQSLTIKKTSDGYELISIGMWYS